MFFLPFPSFKTEFLCEVLKCYFQDNFIENLYLGRTLLNMTNISDIQMASVVEAL